MRRPSECDGGICMCSRFSVGHAAPVIHVVHGSHLSLCLQLAQCFSQEDMSSRLGYRVCGGRLCIFVIRCARGSVAASVTSTAPKPNMDLHQTPHTESPWTSSSSQFAGIAVSGPGLPRSQWDG